MYRPIAVLVISLALGAADQSQAQPKNQLGKVDLQNSCSPGV
jgi:tetratricopeptide (TPR) repeat protein